MKLLTKLQFVTLFLANVLTLTACSNPSMSKNKVTAENAIQQKQKTSKQASSSTVQADIDKAKKAGKAVFVVVTGTGVTETDKATAIAKDAQTIYKNAVIVQMDRDDAANNELVTKWRLSGAPLPLILVVSCKGYPTGGYILSEATAQKLADLVASPKLDEVYEALNNSKAAIIVITKKSYTDRAKILENCKTAKTQLKNQASIIEIDPTDTKEAAFIKQLNVNIAPNTTSVIVLNAAGQTTGTFEGSVEVDKLVAAANKVIKSGCCPGGSGASCAPKK